MPVILTQPFLGFSLASFATADLVQVIIERAEANRSPEPARRGTAPLRIGYLNAATTNLAFESADYARLLGQMDCLYADGQAVVWAARWLGAPITERINAGDFMGEFLPAMASRGLRLALVGGRPGQGDNVQADLPDLPAVGEAAGAAARFAAMAPGLEIVFVHHGYFNEVDAPHILEAIEVADPDVVLLGMGSPRQERLALAWAAGARRPRVWWSVGALFEYFAGTRRRAPVWVRRAGLEWVVRLALEPRRLWRRYLVGNPLFVGRVLRRRPPRGLANPPTSCD